jgi:uncharacterized cupin superfamily protein
MAKSGFSCDSSVESLQHSSLRAGGLGNQTAGRCGTITGALLTQTAIGRARRQQSAGELFKPNSRSGFMPEISVQHQCASLTDLKPCDSFGEPVGPLPLQTDSGFYNEGNMITGTWECEPGTLELDLDLTEFCHLLEGHWKFTSEAGVVTEVKAGDSWVFPRGWKGTAEVIEKVRKVYMMILPA